MLQECGLLITFPFSKPFHTKLNYFLSRHGFSGCIQRVKVQGVSLDTTDSKHLHGQNIGECPSVDEES